MAGLRAPRDYPGLSAEPHNDGKCRDVSPHSSMVRPFLEVIAGKVIQSSVTKFPLRISTLPIFVQIKHANIFKGGILSRHGPKYGSRLEKPLLA